MRVLISSVSSFWLNRKAVIRARELGAEWAKQEHISLHEEREQLSASRARLSPEEEWYPILHDVPRHDPVLLQIYDEMGPNMGVAGHEVYCIEVPDDVTYSIGSYCAEWVEEVHRVWHDQTPPSGAPSSSSDGIFTKNSVFNR